MSKIGFVIAQPFTSKWCGACRRWIYVDAPPFAENDRTKPRRDMIHVDVHHPELVEVDPRGFGASYPWMTWNDMKVTALFEEVAR